MLVLLPPSETKRAGGEGSFMPSALTFDAELGEARDRVREALVRLCETDEEAAAKALKLGVKNRAELERNLELDTSGVLPAIERYTGVLYDALDVSGLTDAARDWADTHVVVQSALFGTVTANDEIPAYRLSAGSRLPALGGPLKRIWAAAHATIDWSAHGLILDLRSKDYGALAPLPDATGWFLHVAQRGDDGEVRALNHFNKAAKGDLVRRLAGSLANLTDIGELIAWAADEGLEMTADEAARTVTLVTEMTVAAPASRRRFAAG